METYVSNTFTWYYLYLSILQSEIWDSSLILILSTPGSKRPRLNTSITSSLTLLLVMHTGDHTVEPKERDNTLMTPAESTVTGVPSSPNLQSTTCRIKLYTLNGNFCQVLLSISQGKKLHPL